MSPHEWSIIAAVLSVSCFLAIIGRYHKALRRAQREVNATWEYVNHLENKCSKLSSELFEATKSIAACYARVQYIEAKWNADHSGAGLHLQLFGTPRIEIKSK